ncbi:hypothetical protein B0H14DRAFT_175456 [Mycena olivaceomarginata]|nr:hypothetical protein B0H14DRAFT_175456 [Mycena olivaceomarginata]
MATEICARTGSPPSPQSSVQRVPIPITPFEEMSDIDDEIAWHYAQIALLKAKRNAIAPIRRLPNELVVRILTIYAVESDALFDLKWTKVMYVCHHWHALALAAQQLWAFIDLQRHGPGTLHRLFVQLERSGVAPLNLKLNFRDSSYYVAIILDHSERIRKLEVGGDFEYVYELIAKLPDGNFPILCSLSLDASYSPQEPQEPWGLPEAFFEGRLPNLRELTLESIPVPWTALSCLTTLALTQCNDSSISLPPTFHGLLDMLASCPQLRTLKLDLMIPPPMPEQIYVTVDLPALSWLYLLSDPITSCETFLKHIRIPPATSIQILPLGLLTGADARAILVPIRRHLRSPGARRPLLFHITRTIASYCTMSVFGDTAPHDFLDHASMRCPLSFGCHPRTEGALRQILTKVLKAIPTESITHLDAYAGYNLGAVTWKIIIKLLPALETIYLLGNTGAVNCVRALGEIQAQDNQIQRRTFPHIRRLHIRILRPEAGSDTIVLLLTALEEYLQLCSADGNLLQALEFEDRYHVLAGRQERLESLFPLLAGGIRCNGVVYDPIQRKEALAEWEAERLAFAAEYGIEI